MEYVQDIDFRYEQDIVTYLRHHNAKFVGECESSKSYFYAFKNDQLVGALHTSLFWDWVSLGDMFYDGLDVLESLLKGVVEHFGNRAVGIKYFTEVPTRVNDLERVGFVIGGSTKATAVIPAYLFLKAIGMSFHSDSTILIDQSEQPIIEHEEVLKRYVHAFEIKHRVFSAPTQSVSFVALDGEMFAGGIYAVIEADSMYISRLAVPPQYRGLNIGSKLMHMLEAHAVDLDLFNITTGTCSFQAKTFYERLGYEVLFTKENDPRGYESYSLEKTLRQL